MEQTCSALQFAHERNVVHRDIKPANIMLTADDTVKVTDFGTAKILQIGTVQQTAHVVGTPSYMSPEQVKGRAVDGRSDIFSLGVMLYEMIAGEKPFPGQSITTVIYKIVNEEPVPPQQINPSIHPGISAAVMKALAKEPEARYQSCREFLEDLRNYRNVAGASGSSQSLMVMGGRQASPTASVAMSGGLRGLHNQGPTNTPTGRSLAASGGNPMQTPALRRTGVAARYEEPQKKSSFRTILGALVLLGVIAYGGYKLRPIYNDMQNLRKLRAGAASETSAVASATPTDSSAATAQPDTNEPASATAANPPVETALQVGANNVSAQKIGLESPAKGLFISSQPEGADVFINGAKQSGQTPVTLPLAPGQYNLVLRLQGYSAYSGNVQVKDNIQTQLATKLTEKSNNRVAWAQVDTNPKGAEIFVDGNSIGKSTPSRIELPIGLHTVTLELDGFQPLKRTVEVSDGGTVSITESLKPN
jgi:Protein kinase domain/PEGA domain